MPFKNLKFLLAFAPYSNAVEQLQSKVTEKQCKKL